jgi:Zn-dependent M28 family amino/carboxypeptidase
MIELARYYKKLNNNERTLIFVAFTGEEIGMFGSKYFSNNIDPEKVVAMINIEMIGKDSKFGPNCLYITGYEASNLGKLMQENLKGSAFTFHPDPYTTQNLFYRSDNAVLAALGVPAHTFSTSQIDKDQYYHTVKDEVSTLDINNIKSSIEAIATGAIGIINGSQTPSRVEKLRD